MMALPPVENSRVKGAVISVVTQYQSYIRAEDTS